MLKTPTQQSAERIAALPACIRPHIQGEDNCWSFVPTGWHNLVERLHNHLVEIDPNYEIVQVKEKFGSLRFYITRRFDEDDLMWIVIQHYEGLSQRLCEVCGEQRFTEMTKVVNTAHYGPRCREHRYTE